MARATSETDDPGANDAATISRFSASGHARLRRRPVAVVSITNFVDTSRPHNTKDQIELGEMNQFWKAAFGGGRPNIPRGASSRAHPLALMQPRMSSGSSNSHWYPSKSAGRLPAVLFCILNPAERSVLRWRVAGYQRRDRVRRLHCEGDVAANSRRQGQLRVRQSQAHAKRAARCVDAHGRPR